MLLGIQRQISKPLGYEARKKERKQERDSHANLRDRKKETGECPEETFTLTVPGEFTASKPKKSSQALSFPEARKPNGCHVLNAVRGI